MNSAQYEKYKYRSFSIQGLVQSKRCLEESVVANVCEAQKSVCIFAYLCIHTPRHHTLPTTDNEHLKYHTFFFFLYLGPVCLSSGSTSALRLIVRTLNFHQHRFSIPVSLIKRHRSLSEAVLISFGSTNYFPKML
jgi:hypothetical protein